MSELQHIRSYLKSLNFHFLDTWVTECVSYYKSNNPSIGLLELKQEVQQQWLLVNLRDLKVPALPSNLSTFNKVTLPGRYVVQVETMFDASVSAYGQLQRLRNVNTENIETTKRPVEWEIKANRCLTMTLSDGVQEIQGMEYQPIPALRLNDPDLLPGFKMLLVGPVVCRRGMVMLKADNVKLYGGEVDVMCGPNQLERVLERKLNLEETEEQPAVQDTVEDVIVPRNEDDTQEQGLTGNNDVTRLLEDDGEDDILMNMLDEEFERQVTPTHPPPIPEKRSRLESDSLVSPTSSSDLPKRQKCTYSDNTSRTQQQTTLTKFFQSGPTQQNLCKTIKSKPFVYLKQISDALWPRNQIFIVKAIIVTLLTKVGIQDEKFNLKAVITDGSLSVPMDFSSDVLENILGFSPCEMVAMMKQKNKNSAIADRIRNSFQKTQQKLISLNCLMHISTHEAEPKVVELQEVTIEHLTALKSRQL